MTTRSWCLAAAFALHALTPAPAAELAGAENILLGKRDLDEITAEEMVGKVVKVRVDSISLAFGRDRPVTLFRVSDGKSTIYVAAKGKVTDFLKTRLRKTSRFDLNVTPLTPELRSKVDITETDTIDILKAPIWYALGDEISAKDLEDISGSSF